MTKAKLEDHIKNLQDYIKKLECEIETLRLELKQKNNRNAGRKPYITSKEVEKMKEMRANGKSYAYIGQAFGVSSTSVYNKLNSL